MNSPPSYKEILKLLREIRAGIWIGNYEDRLRAVNKRIDLLEGSEERREQRIKAVEDYLGIEFNTKYRYEIKKQKTTRGLRKVRKSKS